MTIFLRPSSPAELERRLRNRGTETEEAIQRRLAQAQGELALADRYQYQVINDDMDQAVHEIVHILNPANGRRVKMIDELREEEIVKKVGGRFKLSTLIQKRLVQLNAGAARWWPTRTDNKMQIVINEILQDKIYLDMEMNVQVAAAGDRAAHSRMDDGLPQRYERPRTVDRRHRRDRGLQDRGPGEPVGAGRRRRHGGNDPLGHAAGRAQDLRGLDRPAGEHPRLRAPARIRTSSWPNGPNCCAWPPPRPTSWPRRPAAWPTIC